MVLLSNIDPKSVRAHDCSTFERAFPSLECNVSTRTRVLVLVASEPINGQGYTALPVELIRVFCDYFRITYSYISNIYLHIIYILFYIFHHYCLGTKFMRLEITYLIRHHSH